MAARTITVATILADIATLSDDDRATLRSTLGIATRKASEASQHWTARDLACPAKGCDKTFRSEGGRTWHVDNVHGKAK